MTFDPSTLKAGPGMKVPVYEFACGCIVQRDPVPQERSDQTSALCPRHAKRWVKLTNYYPADRLGGRLPDA